MKTQRDFLDPLRRAVRSVGFPDGIIEASLHNGKFLWAELAVSSLAYGKASQRPLRRCPCFSPPCFAEIFRRRLKRVFRWWPRPFGKFRFRVQNREIIEWWFSARVKPGEENDWMSR